MNVTLNVTLVSYNRGRYHVGNVTLPTANVTLTPAKVTFRPANVTFTIASGRQRG